MNQFDELTKSLAQSLTRRAALKKLGVGLAGMALACFGLAKNAAASRCKPAGTQCNRNTDCCSGRCYFQPWFGGKNNATNFGICTQ
jgi:hypothetical protein